jgi:hypothetical protein
MEPEELRRLLEDNSGSLSQYYRYINQVANQQSEYNLEDLFDGELSWGEASKKKTKKVAPKKFAELEDLNVDALSRIKTTIEKYEAGYRPYLIDIQGNVFRPLADLDEVYSIGDCKFVWLLPKIAEKIAERFESITKIEKEVDDFTKASYRKIGEYEDRIRQLLDKGHDLLL